jgi:5-hydroxyisourate hydrolase-like protein (transthyretin family)
MGSFASVLVASFALALPVAQQGGSVSGVVKLDGKPARSTRVCLVRTAGDRRPMASAVTDEQGRYHLGDVPPGTYLVAVHAPACVVENGDIAENGSGRLVTLADGGSMTGVDISLVPGGVVTGRVTTASGEPVIGVGIELRRVGADGQPDQVTNVDWRILSTDDRGTYRIFGLAAGRYVVSAGGSDDLGGAISVGSGAVTFRKTFHPGTTDPARAEAVDVTPGSVTKGIDVVLADEVKLYAVSGRATHTGSNAPVVGASGEIGELVDGQLSGTLSGAFATDANGAFHIMGLEPGSYLLGFTAGADGSVADPIRFDVVDADVSGLRVVFRSGATIAGVVVVEGADADAARASLANVFIYANRSYGPDAEPADEIASGSGAAIGADGSFALKGLRPGRYPIEFGSQANPRPLAVVRVERGGETVGPEIEIGESDRVVEVRIVVVAANCALKGRLRIEGEIVPRSAEVVVFRRREAGEDYLGRSRVDERGQYFLDSLLPGDAVVFPLATPARAGANGARARGKPVSVRLVAGETVDADLEIDVRPKDGAP